MHVVAAVRCVCHLGCFRRIAIVLAYYPLLAHQVEHSVAPHKTFTRIFVGRVHIGGFYHCSQRCGFGDGQFVRGLAEVNVCGVLYPVGTAPEVNGVEVHFQYFRLGKVAFQLSRQYHFVQFALVGFFSAEVRVFYQLLGDGGRAFFFAAAFKVGKQSRRNTHDVNAVMPEKAFVFDGNKRHVHVFRQRGNGRLLFAADGRRLAQNAAFVVQQSYRPLYATEFVVVQSHVFVAVLPQCKRACRCYNAAYYGKAYTKCNYFYGFVFHVAIIVCNLQRFI